MAKTTESPSDGMRAAKQHFLETYEQEHRKTMRLLRAYPTDKLDLKPVPTLRSARELAWVFVQERGLGTAGFQDAFAKGVPSGRTPAPPPESWDQLLDALEKAHQDFANVVRNTSEEDLAKPIKFLVAPKTLGDFRRIDFAWYVLLDQIHHRGQFSVYARMAGGEVPSIYGPTADQPWL
jgi:uncharacterized damage-inducible protein DinB